MVVTVQICDLGQPSPLVGFFVVILDKKSVVVAIRWSEEGRVGAEGGLHPVHCSNVKGIVVINTAMRPSTDHGPSMPREGVCEPMLRSVCEGSVTIRFR